MAVLPYARFANQYRIVFFAPAEYLRHAFNLFFTAHDRVELVIFGQFCEVTAKIVEDRSARFLRCFGRSFTTSGRGASPENAR
jgi:hypothetical protein